MRRAAYYKLVDKSRSACIAAIETYNRASCQYREESFAILMINAWELLLKARMLQHSSGKLNAIYEYRNKKRKDGTTSKLREVKLTRSGSPMTIGLDKCCHIVSGYQVNRIDMHCIKNIEALLEIRDSATHFINDDPLLNRALVEISLASVKNYVTAVQKWFSISFADLNIASIPLSFDLDQNEVEAIAKKSPAAVINFLKHMQLSEASLPETATDFAFAVRVHFDLVKKKSDTAVTAAIVGDDPDLTLSVDDDKVPAGFVWDYKTLTEKLKRRYSDFKLNAEYHSVRKPFEANKKLCFLRYLDPSKKGSSSKKFYNPNILKMFDEHYTLKSDDLFGPETDHGMIIVG